MNRQTILLISDMRQVYLAEIMTKRGLNVRCLDIRNSGTVKEQLEKLKSFLAEADMLILPIPVTKIPEQKMLNDILNKNLTNDTLVLGVKKWECEVISNRNISTFLKEFVVKLPEGENLKFRSGGYIQIDIPKYDAIKFSDMDIEEPYREDWDKMKMWDLVTKNPEPTFRAYSMANHPAEGNIIMLNIRIATPPFDRATGTFAKVNPGICSSYIFSRKPGDKVTISGPYGEFFLPDNLPATQELVFIGGGAGMAPMRSHIMHLFKTEKTSRPVSFWYGARALKEVPYMDEFLEIQREFPNFKFHLALDRPDPQADAAGVKYTPGFVHNVLYENYLKNHQAPEDNIYLMCGPPMMISSVVKMLDSLGVPSENILYDNFGS